MIGKIFLLSFIAIVSTGYTYAENVKINIKPTSPVRDTIFDFNIIISDIKSDELPFVSFDPGTIEVLDKINNASVTSSRYSSNLLKTRRKISYTYKLSTKHSGVNYLKNIKIVLGSKTVYFRKRFAVHVTSIKKRVKNIFLETEVDKDEMFLGEGVTVSYYIYSRFDVARHSYVKFPKYKNWIKRYNDLSNSQEIIKLNDNVYKKIKVYSAKLFPLKSGLLRIDRISIKAHVTNLYNRTSGRGLVAKLLTSNTVKVKVKEIVSLKIPNDYSGLVGNFKMSYKINKLKFFKNEVIEIVLSLQGEGQLESYKAPLLLNSDLVEIFDQQSSLLNIKSNPIKIIKYTFLCRKAGLLKGYRFTQSFYNPKSMSMYQKEILIPSIVISDVNVNESIQKNQKLEEKVEVLNTLSPSFRIEKLYGIFNFNIIKYIALLVLLILIIPWKKFRFVSSHEADVIRNGVNYSSFKAIFKNVAGIGSLSAVEIIGKIKLNQKDKKYLLKLYSYCLEEYSSRLKKPGNYKVNKRKLKRIIKEINENNKKC